MGFTFEIDSREVSNAIGNAVRTSINSTLRLVANDIHKNMLSLIDKLLTNSPEYRSISNGLLAQDLEIPNAHEALSDILSIIRDSLEVTIQSVTGAGGLLQGSINIIILKDGINDLLSLSSGKYQGKLFEVPWLEWLLTQGDKIIVAGYNIKYNVFPANRSNLSGIGVMEKGGGWRIPPNFSGTEDSNWITRTFNVAVVQQEMSIIVQKSLSRNFS